MSKKKPLLSSRTTDGCKYFLKNPKVLRINECCKFFRNYFPLDAKKTPISTKRALWNTLFGLLFFGKIFTKESKINIWNPPTPLSVRNTRVLRPLSKSLILRGNRRLQIFGHFFILQNFPKIVLNIPILACESYPFVSRKVTFDLAKGILSHSKSLPFAKLEVKIQIFASTFSNSHSRMKIFRELFSVI